MCQLPFMSFAVEYFFIAERGKAVTCSSWEKDEL